MKNLDLFSGVETEFSDINGVKVFEFDVLEAENGNTYHVEWREDLGGFVAQILWVVFWNKSRWLAAKEEFEEYKIIGSSNTNPALLHPKLRLK